MNKKVLLVEDEFRMRKLIKDYFKKEDFSIFEASDGEEALTIFSSEKNFDLIILDIMIPKLDGFAVCKTIRQTSNVPIIMLTAKSQEEDKLLGFEIGADEYVTKPFSPKVLVARANALLKRIQGSLTNSEETYIQDDFKVNFLSREVLINGVKINLSPKEFDLLEFMIKNQNISLTRNQLLDNVWGYDYYGDLRTVDTHIKRLRTKLEDKAKFIVTVRGSGYMFQA